jgi:NADH dehydrogenase FAD-containing subunit
MQCARTNQPSNHNPSHHPPDALPYQQRSPTRSNITNNTSSPDRQRVIVLGSGWAGYSLSRDLDPRKYQIVVVSPRPYFVFTPLLASTSVGTLEFRCALEPTRARKGEKQGPQFFQGWADGVDFEHRTLQIEESVEDPSQSVALAGEKPTTGESLEALRAKGKVFEMGWDKLVVAVGCYSQTFGTKGVREHAYFLKDVKDARKIRNRLLSCFETASLPTTSEEMKRMLLNFAVVGGGPTGIEWSAELCDMIEEDMSKLYPELKGYAKVGLLGFASFHAEIGIQQLTNAKKLQITVYDVAPKVLSMFDEKLGNYALNHFKRRGIDIRTSHHVNELRPGVPSTLKESVRDEAGCYTLDLKEEGEVGVGMCVWSTGLMMNPFVEKHLQSRVALHEKTHGILTDDRLRAKRPDGTVMENVHALGDCAVLEGTAYPATAQVANQKAGWLAKRLNKGDLESQGFTYKNLGVMAYVGNWNAIMQTEGGDVSGRVAWFIWRGAYLAKSVSWRNRILIPVYWFVNWVFGRDISRF